MSSQDGVVKGVEKVKTVNGKLQPQRRGETQRRKSPTRTGQNGKKIKQEGIQHECEENRKGCAFAE
jgi:hypothetical protein